MTVSMGPTVATACRLLVSSLLAAAALPGASPMWGGVASAQDASFPAPPGGPTIDKSRDRELQDMIAQVLPRFRQSTYVDEQTGLTVPYNLFVPEGAGTGGPLPLVYFIADASVAGQGVTAPLEQGYGGLIWATEADQERRPSFVLVPEFPEVILDDHDGYVMTEYVDLAARLVRSVAAEVGADPGRIYATGQSMGCMTLMYLTAQNPDLFAAQLFVSGQWDTRTLTGLADAKFFYVVAEGDPKASAGQRELRAALEAEGAEIGSAVWDAGRSGVAMSDAVSALVSEGHPINFVSFEEGTVMPEGVQTPGGSGEHMYSFDPAYEVEAVRSWLFEQSR